MARYGLNGDGALRIIRKDGTWPGPAKAWRATKGWVRRMRWDCIKVDLICGGIPIAVVLRVTQMTLGSGWAPLALGALWLPALVFAESLRMQLSGEPEARFCPLLCQCVLMLAMVAAMAYGNLGDARGLVGDMRVAMGCNAAIALMEGCRRLPRCLAHPVIDAIGLVAVGVVLLSAPGLETPHRWPLALGALAFPGLLLAMSIFEQVAHGDWGGIEFTLGIALWLCLLALATTFSADREGCLLASLACGLILAIGISTSVAPFAPIGRGR